jgi:hypothetical protein
VNDAKIALKTLDYEWCKNSYNSGKNPLKGKEEREIEAFKISLFK